MGYPLLFAAGDQLRELEILISIVVVCRPAVEPFATREPSKNGHSPCPALAGMFGLLHAARAFDPARGKQFSTLATLAIRQRLQHALSRAKPIKQLSVDEYGDPIKRPAPESPDHTEIQELLGRLLRVLPALHRRAVQLRFGLAGEKPMALTEIGLALGVSGSRPKQLIERAVARLRAEVRRIGLLDFRAGSSM